MENIANNQNKSPSSFSVVRSSISDFEFNCEENTSSVIHKYFNSNKSPEDFLSSDSDVVCLEDESLELHSPQNHQEKLACASKSSTGNYFVNKIKRKLEFKERTVCKRDSEYVADSRDIYVYLKQQELKYRPSAEYASLKLWKSSNARNIVLDNIIFFPMQLYIENEIFHLSVLYMDRFLSRVPTAENKLVSTGLACLLIALKYNDSDISIAKDLFQAVQSLCSKTELQSMEKRILNALSFELNDPTIYYFLRYLCYSIDLSDVICCLVQLIVEISFKNIGTMLKYLPSLLATAAIYSANLVADVFTSDIVLQAVSGYKIQEIKESAYLLHKEFLDFCASPSEFLHEKYKSEEYTCISDLIIPEI